MKIVVLDGYALNPGDNPWDEIAAFGDLTVYDRTAPDEVVSRAAGAEVIFTNKTVVGREELSRLPDLRYIGVLATGYNIVDVAAARERGILVTNVPCYSTDSVAELTFGHILDLARGVGAHARWTSEGNWVRAEDYSQWICPQIELRGKILGIVGFGRIGARVAELGRAFGMPVIAYTPHPGIPPEGVRFGTLEEVLAAADFVTLHCPAKAGTVGMVDREFLSRMKPTAFLINTSRGQLIVPEDLAEALNAHRIAGAALDVMEQEPPRPDDPLLTAENAQITPHIAWATFEARKRLMHTAAENLRAFLSGAPENVVNL